MEVVRFTRMDQGTAEEYAFLDRELLVHSNAMRATLPAAMLKLLDEQRGLTLGYRIDRLQHSLQTATWAFRDGADEETVVAALLHDVGDGIGAFNHSEFAASLLRPFLSDRNAWVIHHHGLFQGYYYFQHVGRQRDERDRYRDHPHFQACADFCERWDQRSFDPEFDTMPIEAFEPMVHRVFAREPRGFE